MLDVGCGYGFWGFICSRCINSLKYVVGFDIDLDKVRKAKPIYDDVLLADAKAPPFRGGSFDAVLAVEVLHGLGEEAVKSLVNVHRKLLIVTYPSSNRELIRLLEGLGFIGIYSEALCSWVRARFTPCTIPGCGEYFGSF
jgi:SAM-dependent methyltransferase